MAKLDERRIRWLLAAVGLGSFVLLLALEIVTEADEISLFDLAVDALGLLLTIVAAVGVALLAQRVQAQREEKAALLRDLELARAEGESWRAKVQANLDGIRAEIAHQFRQWGMTAAEQEIGLLILKGLNHKQIAALRGTSEATVRQQAQAIYRKADLPGKTAFSAYFLEDLFAPDFGAADPPAARPVPAGDARAPAQPSKPGPRRV
ncbi:MAG TPA: hypothetical protein VFY19_11765 [Geminicoccaceae bacterium]|nr:hypothetical protein [Geminicoccaceae bacterium]